MLARIEGGSVRLITRNGNDWTAQAAGAGEGAAKPWSCPTAGTTARSSCRATGVPADFQALQSAFDSARTGGHRLLPVRPALLRRLRPARRAAGGAPRRAAAHRRAQAARQGALQRGVRRPSREDMLRLGLPAGPGRRDRQAPRLGLRLRRSSDWIKLKCGQRQEFVIGGYTDPKGSRTGLGSLLLGVHDKDGRAALRRQRRHRLQRADAARAARASSTTLARRRQPLRRPTPSCRASAHWVKPELVGEVCFRRVDARRPHPPLGVPRPAHRQASRGDHARGAAPHGARWRQAGRTAAAAEAPTRCPPRCASATPTA